MTEIIKTTTAISYQIDKQETEKGNFIETKELYSLMNYIMY